MINFIKSKENTKIKHLLKLMNDKKYRKEHNEIVFEGTTVLNELIAKKIQIKSFFINELFWDEFEYIHKNYANVYMVAKNINISDVKTYQGITFITDAPKINNLENPKNIILLDDINDPGNLGTIIRCVSAFGIDTLILSKETVDYTMPKAVRASMGSIFDTNICIMDITQAIDILKSKNIKVYATYLDKTSLDISSVNLKNTAVIMGNEARGISQEILGLVDEKIIIPININSLNVAVASAIIMHHQR